MIVLSNFLFAVSYILNVILNLVFWLIIIRVILSWVNPDPGNPIVRFLNSATDPLFRKARELIPLRIGIVDFSPFVLIFGIYFIQIFLVGTLEDYGKKIKMRSFGGQQRQHIESLDPGIMM